MELKNIRSFDDYVNENYLNATNESKSDFDLESYLKSSKYPVEIFTPSHNPKYKDRDIKNYKSLIKFLKSLPSGDLPFIKVRFKDDELFNLTNAFKTVNDFENEIKNIKESIDEVNESKFWADVTDGIADIWKENFERDLIDLSHPSNNKILYTIDINEMDPNEKKNLDKFFKSVDNFLKSQKYAKSFKIGKDTIMVSQ